MKYYTLRGRRIVPTASRLALLIATACVFLTARGQKVTVEHVHINKGGQAIVGAVNQEGVGATAIHTCYLY